MKSYTDIEQSRKLVDILSTESADMYYQYILPKSDKIKHIPENGNPKEALEWYNKGYTHFGKEPLSLKEYCIPCWSLAALINALPSATLDNSRDHYCRIHCMGRFTEWYENSVDACVAMIEKLHELKML